jgi:soluble lytic murein transglycosylase-like protein
MNFKDEITAAANKYQVSSLWIKAIITQESNWNKYALRYEPAYNYLLKPDEFAKKVGTTLNTEIQVQKMSWGLGQIMGALAREQGHLGPMGELFDPFINISMLAQRLNTIMKYTHIQNSVFSAYNGGLEAWHYFTKNGKYSNESYVDSVNKHLQAIQKGDLCQN